MQERPSFTKAASGRQISDSLVQLSWTPILAASRFPEEPPGAAQPWRVPAFVYRENTAAVQYWKPSCGGAFPVCSPARVQVCSRGPQFSADPQLFPPIPCPNTHFPVPPLSMLSPPPPHSASEASRLPDEQTEIALTPLLIPAGRSRGPFHSIPAEGRREEGSSDRQCFNGPCAAEEAAPSLQSPAPESSQLVPRMGEGCITHAQWRLEGGGLGAG